MQTFESTDYERFSYDEGESTLTLEQAIKKAADLRRGDAEHFYRVKARDQNANEFHVEKVPKTSAYTEFLSRLMKNAVRHTRAVR